MRYIYTHTNIYLYWFVQIPSSTKLSCSPWLQQGTADRNAFEILRMPLRMLFSLLELSYMHIFCFDKGSKSASRAGKVMIKTWLSELGNICQIEKNMNYNHVGFFLHKTKPHKSGTFLKTVEVGWKNLCPKCPVIPGSSLTDFWLPSRVPHLQLLQWTLQYEHFSRISLPAHTQLINCVYCTM